MRHQMSSPIYFEKSMIVKNQLQKGIKKNPNICGEPVQSVLKNYIALASIVKT